MINERRSLGFVLLLAASAACKEEPPPSPGEPGAGDDVLHHIAGQTGDEGATPWRPPGGVSDNPVCPVQVTSEALASLDEVTDLGFSAADVLSSVGGSREGRVHWNARPVMPDYLDYAVQVTPGDVDETVRLELASDGTSPRYRRGTLAGSDAGADLDHCRSRIELGVTVELRSESGAFDELWRGTLTAPDVSEAVVLLEAPTWRGRLPLQPDRDEGNFVNAQEGSLNVVDANDPGSELAWMDVLLRFRTSAIDGSVNGWVQTSSGGAFVVPQHSDDRDAAGWIGVIGEGFYENVWAIQ